MYTHTTSQAFPSMGKVPPLTVARPQSDGAEE